MSLSYQYTSVFSFDSTVYAVGRGRSFTLELAVCNRRRSTRRVTCGRAEALSLGITSTLRIAVAVSLSSCNDVGQCISHSLACAVLLCRGESTGIIPTARILINFGIYRHLICSGFSNRICVIIVLGLTCISIRIGCAVFRRCAEVYLGFISIIAA